MINSIESFLSPFKNKQKPDLFNVAVCAFLNTRIYDNIDLCIAQFLYIVTVILTRLEEVVAMFWCLISLSKVSQPAALS